MELQTSLGLLASRDASRFLGESLNDPHGREPFEHPATTNIETLLGNAKSFFTHHRQIARVAEEYEIPSVVRWQPKNVSCVRNIFFEAKLTSMQPENLQGSGSDMVYAQTVYAIIGALAMEQGGAVANRITREKVIESLGIQKGFTGASEALETS